MKTKANDTPGFVYYTNSMVVHTGCWRQCRQLLRYGSFVPYASSLRQQNFQSYGPSQMSGYKELLVGQKVVLDNIAAASQDRQHLLGLIRQYEPSQACCVRGVIIEEHPGKPGNFLVELDASPLLLTLSLAEVVASLQDAARSPPRVSQAQGRGSVAAPAQGPRKGSPGAPSIPSTSAAPLLHAPGSVTARQPSQVVSYTSETRTILAGNTTSVRSMGRRPAPEPQHGGSYPGSGAGSVLLAAGQQVATLPLPASSPWSGPTSMVLLTGRKQEVESGVASDHNAERVDGGMQVSSAAADLPEQPRPSAASLPAWQLAAAVSVGPTVSLPHSLPGGMAARQDCLQARQEHDPTFVLQAVTVGSNSLGGGGADQGSGGVGGHLNGRGKSCGQTADGDGGRGRESTTVVSNEELQLLLALSRAPPGGSKAGPGNSKSASPVCDRSTPEEGSPGLALELPAGCREEGSIGQQETTVPATVLAGGTSSALHKAGSEAPAATDVPPDAPPAQPATAPHTDASADEFLPAKGKAPGSSSKVGTIRAGTSQQPGHNAWYGGPAISAPPPLAPLAPALPPVTSGPASQQVSQTWPSDEVKRAQPEQAHPQVTPSASLQAPPNAVAPSSCAVALQPDTQRNGMPPAVLAEGDPAPTASSSLLDELNRQVHAYALQVAQAQSSAPLTSSLHVGLGLDLGAGQGDVSGVGDTSPVVDAFAVLNQQVQEYAKAAQQRMRASSPTPQFQQLPPQDPRPPQLSHLPASGSSYACLTGPPSSSRQSGSAARVRAGGQALVTDTHVGGGSSAQLGSGLTPLTSGLPAPHGLPHLLSLGAMSNAILQPKQSSTSAVLAGMGPDVQGVTTLVGKRAAHSRLPESGGVLRSPKRRRSSAGSSGDMSDAKLGSAGAGVAAGMSRLGSTGVKGLERQEVEEAMGQALVNFLLEQQQEEGQGRAAPPLNGAPLSLNAQTSRMSRFLRGQVEMMRKMLPGLVKATDLTLATTPKHRAKDLELNG